MMTNFRGVRSPLHAIGDGRIGMDWINRYIDQPLLHGAAGLLRGWHIRTRQPPELLEPTWNLVVLSFLLILSGQVMAGKPFALSITALVMLALPSARKLLSAVKAGGGGYGAREYKSLRARAIAKREAEWSVRIIVLFASACLPFIARIDDPVGAYFMLGASIWFVLTGPLKAYLDAAEPPEPNEGDQMYNGVLHFG
ncbi:MULTISPECIES: hypothetical protein [Rhizobium]|uniref:hypothetical protein n=1 Tax=Rhizobium TaxID=379 RepID=UPI00234F1AC3|nr:MULTISPECIES: hypothetical protein [unclassified Rhizobium]MDC7746142.1 hypothetical protein [Rhizobium sp. BC56]MDC9812241.1 hypothetical protein [Rhizobium sp. MC62]MDC9836103.1 hypothetical protein [Rhizobium sp. MJ37]